MRLHRHLFVSVARPFILGIGLLVLVVFLFQARRLAQASFGLGVTLSDLAVIFASALLPFMVFAIPLAVLFGVLIGLHQRHRHGELDAWRASGTSIWQLSLPALALGAIVSLVSLPLSLFGEPVGLTALHERLIAVGLANLSQAVRPGIITEDFAGSAIYAGSKDEDGSLRDLVVFDERKPERATVALAERGIMKRQGRNLNFELEQGELLLRSASQVARYERLRFGKASFGLNTEDELLRRTRFVSPLGMVMPDELLALAARQEPGSAFGRRVEKVYWRRYGLASMAFIFALLGTAIVLSGRPHHRMRSAVWGLGAVLGYYILSRIADWMEVQMSSGAIVGALAPNFVLLVVGVVILARANRAVR